MEKLINLVKYIIIGIIQGISEILPISSSGHLAISYYLLNIDNDIQFDLTVFLHLASSVALCIFFKDVLSNMIKGSFIYIFKKDTSRKDDFFKVVYLIISSFPIILVGFFIKPFIENYFDNIYCISISFIISAIVIFISYKLKGINNTYNFKNTFITGVFQSLALLPGLSRSAFTILGGKIGKLNENKSKEFAFLLLIPVSIGSSFLAILDVISNKNINVDNLVLYIISMIFAFIFTFMSLKLFFNKTSKIPYYFYGIYLLILSLIIFTFIM